MTERLDLPAAELNLGAFTEVDQLRDIAQHLLTECRELSRLLDEARDYAESWEEDALFFAGTDPDDAELVLHEEAFDEPLQGLLEHFPNAGRARREVRCGRWKVLDAPGGDD